MVSAPSPLRLAVFTSTYPARVATFFERDMRALLDAGVAIDVFAVAPLDQRLWRYRLDILGEDNVMWGSDYPHPDGIWPDSQEFLNRELAGVSAEARRKITRDNAMKLYRLSN